VRKALVGIGVCGVLTVGLIALQAPIALAGIPQPPPTGAIVVGTSSSDCPSPTYSTIQSAIDAASSGATIYVCEGTYNESLTINKPLTLDGAQYNVDARNRAGSLETIVDGNGGVTYTSGATSGTINGFTLEGYTGSTAEVDAGGVGYGWSFVDDVVDASNGGIYLNTDAATNPQTSTIGTDLFVQSSPSAATSGNAGKAVVIGGGTGNNVTIADNNFDNLSGPGAAVSTPGTAACGATLDSTNFSENLWLDENINIEDGASFTDPVNGPGFIDEPFLALECTNGARVHSNVVKATAPSDPNAKVALDLAGGDWSTTVSSNTLVGNGTSAAAGVDVNGDAYPAGTGVLVSGNAVSGYDDGIDVRAGTGYSVNYNIVTASTADGITVASTAGGGSLLNNAVSGSTTNDCADATTGTGTASTADSWVNNGGASSSPAGLCAAFLSPSITSPASDTATVGTPYSYTLTAVGYPVPTLSVWNLPYGLTFADNHNGTGTISGTPKPGAAGIRTIHMRAKNVSLTTTNYASEALTLQINKAPKIISASTRNAVPGTSFSFTVTTTGYPHPSLTETGALPPGVTFTDLGTGRATLSGTPTAPLSTDTWPLTITANNAAGTTTQAFVLTTKKPPVFTSPMSAHSVIGQPFSYTITTSSYLTPVLSDVGTLPAGIQFADNGNGTATISGIAAIGSKFEYTIGVTATTVTGSTVRHFHLYTWIAPSFTSASSFTAGVNKAFTFYVKAAGRPKPTISESGALPSGVTYLYVASKGLWTLQGTPTATGSWPITFTATSRAGTVTQSFTLTVQ
jgi:Putative Ig domain